MRYSATLVISLLLCCAMMASAQPAPTGSPKPYRVLVVAGAQMRDNRVIYDAWDFGDIVGLLKLWGVPFDLMRLDTHRMALRDFANADGTAKYGAVIWTARGQREHPWQPQDYAVVAQAVQRYHIGFIAIGNKIQVTPIQQLLGLRYRGFDAIAAPITVSKTPHFLTRDLPTSATAAEVFPDGGPQVSVTGKDVVVLATAGAWPQLTARTLDVPTRTRAVWLGGNPDAVFQGSPLYIGLLRRALVWTIGYAVYKDYPRTVVLRMDDPGGAQSAYFTGWDYAQLDEAAVRRDLLDPLRAHHAVLGVGFTPAFPRLADQTLEHSVTLDFTDAFGRRQNLVSSAAGFRAGQAEGLMEVQDHGLTHMVPDLTTPPSDGANWWKGDLKGEWADERWYREFYDMRRDKEVDAAVQLARLRQAAAWITGDFGTRPLTFIPPGHAISGDWYEEGKVTKAGCTPPHIADTFTYRCAADAGYGLALDLTAHYLGPDYVIAINACDAHEPDADFARHVPAVFLFHDRDVAQDPDYLANLLNRLGDVHYLSMDEWTAYLHTTVAARLAGGACRVMFTPDPAYARFFLAHPAVWTLHLSDDLRHGAPETRTLTVLPGDEAQTLTCPLTPEQ